MLIMLILWLVIAIIIGSAVWFFKRGHDGECAVIITIGVIVVVVVLCVTIILPLSNAGRIQEMVAFYNVNAGAYSTAFEDGKTMLSEQRFIESALVPIEGSIEKQQLAVVVTGYLTDWRNEVVRYNSDLQRMRYFRSNIWTSTFIPKIPDVLQPLCVK